MFFFVDKLCRVLSVSWHCLYVAFRRIFREAFPLVLAPVGISNPAGQIA